MQNYFVKINTVPTLIYSWGQHVNQTWNDEKIDKLILVITGCSLKLYKNVKN